MRIGPFDTDRSVLIVAEIGNNHEGSAAAAADLVRTAAACGVDAVKFQTFRADQYVRKSDTARYERLKRFELADHQFADLSQLAHERGLLFLSTPFNLAAVATLESLVDAYKVASGDNDFFPLLAQIAATGKPMIVSTGVSDAACVDATVGFIRQTWESRGVRGELALLHCVSSYPAPADQLNLHSIGFLAGRFGCTVGYSDHALGVEAAVTAVAAGARVVEKHFTLDKHTSDFRDHQLSADPMEMAELVKRIRTVESMLGAFEKKIQPCEVDATVAIRRSIVAVRDLPAGATIAAGDLKWIRPGGGLHPGSEGTLIGGILRRDVRGDEALSPDDIERRSQAD
jgi:sialic acid synthase SpsE